MAVDLITIERIAADGGLQELSTDDLQQLDSLLFDEGAFADAYWDDPAGFVMECFDWSKLPKDKPTKYQLQILTNLVLHGREAVRGPHGLGKTALASWVVLWFVLTRNARRVDWKVVTTAGNHRQLVVFLWPEIHKWARLLRWEIIGRTPFIEGVELLEQNIKLETGAASAVASNQPGLIEGAHADHILYVFDESKSIMDSIFDAAEGAFSGAGEDTGREAYALSTSTPGPPEGRFHAIHAKKPGLEDWHATHVTCADAIAAGRISQAWADARKRLWGETSAQYKNRVLGEFATSNEDGVIPMEWLEAAIRRWRELKEAGALPKPDGVKVKLTAIGGDVSYGGADKTVVALRLKHIILALRRIYVEKSDRPTTVAAGRIHGILRAMGGTPIIDVIGYGAGVVDQLRELRNRVLAFNAGAAAKRGDRPLTDQTKELEFADMRSAAWWHLRELLDPANGNDVAIPPDEEIEDLGDDQSLEADLLAPKWEVRAGGKIKVESKDDIRERLGRSTDWGDTVMQAFALELMVSGAHGLPIGVESASKWKNAF